MQGLPAQSEFCRAVRRFRGRSGATFAKASSQEWVHSFLKMLGVGNAFISAVAMHRETPFLTLLSAQFKPAIASAMRRIVVSLPRDLEKLVSLHALASIAMRSGAA